MRRRALFLTAWLGVCSVLGGASITGAAVTAAAADDSADNQSMRQAETFSHATVAPGTCATCHNGTTAIGKIANHPVTTASCDTCHSTSTWIVEQPLSNASMWRSVRYGREHTTQVGGRETGVLIQSAGETWRKIRNGPVTLIGGLLLIVVPIVIGLFYRWAGPLRLHGQPTGKLVQRFSYWERIIHWSTAITFVVLAVTGILLLFGKYLLIPIIGYSGFSWLAAISKNVHNIFGPLFIFSVACMFVMFARDNVWKKIDWEWIKKAPQILTGKGHVPTGKYNAGEKAWFWGGVAFLGLVVGFSGLILDFPNFDQTRLTMQIANIVHGAGALLFIAASLGHIYIGTIGTEGAYDAMRTGNVDETWAKEHHELWLNEVKS